MKDGLLVRAATGTLAGVAGTAALKRARVLQKKVAPKTVPRLKEDPGEYVVDKAEGLLPAEKRRQVPEAVEKGAATGLGLAYGALFGALYGVTATRDRNAIVTGAALGAASWAVGYLGLLPALGLAPPVTRQKPLQIVGSLATHVYFGVVTAGAYRRLTAMKEERRGLRGKLLSAIS